MVVVGIKRYLAGLLRWVLPVAVIVLGFCFESAPIQGKISQALIPFAGTMLMIAFAIPKLAFMPPWLVFGLMLFAELYAGAVPGTLAIPGLVVRFILMEQREFFTFAPFMAGWMGVSVLLFLFGLIHWVSVVGFHLTLVDPTPLFLRWVVSVGTYPLAAGAVALINRWIWPVRSVDERLEDRQAQYLRTGMALPAAIRSDKTGKNKVFGKAFEGSVFRRIRRAQEAKPWMKM